MSILRLMILMISVSALLCCCTGRRVHDAHLERVAEEIAVSPGDALRSLDSLYKESHAEWGERDLRYYEFLKLKASDKAYVRHTSDATLLRVIDYAESHAEDYYLESLYYGGRVYSDLGDKPTALKYYQKVLEMLPADAEDKDFRAAVLSQVGSLLASLRLYGEAIPYIKEALYSDVQNGDTANVVLGYNLLGDTYRRTGDNVKSERYLHKGLSLCDGLPESYSASLKVQLAALKYNEGKIDTALSLIRDVPWKVDEISRTTAFAYAARIYLKAGIPDSAYMYAHRIIADPDPLQKRTGYEVILSPELRERVPLDSQYRYLDDYTSILKSAYDGNSSSLAISMRGSYNYSFHVRKKESAERRVDLWLKVAVGFMFLFLVMTTVVLWIKNRHRKHEIELRNALEVVRQLRQELEESGRNADKVLGAAPVEAVVKTENASVGENVLTGKTDAATIREKLRTEFIELANDAEKSSRTQPELAGSAVCRKIERMAEKNEMITDSNPLWDEL